MSVYTSISKDELIIFLSHFDIGTLDDFQGISDGIENTNYFVNTSQKQTVLTIFEELNKKELPFFLDLLDFLAKNNVPCPQPYVDKEGNLFRSVQGKPAAFVKRFSGKGITEPSIIQCSAVGAALAQVHKVTEHYQAHRKNERGLAWYQKTAERLMPVLEEKQATFLAAEIELQASEDYSHLPTSIIHADLFRDNTLFDGDTLTGMIDFYHACNGPMLYDLAITLNDWCSDLAGSLDKQKSAALIQAYHQTRPLQSAEHEAWSSITQAAALRFWLSRMQDKFFPREGEMTQIKDPELFWRILQNRKNSSIPLSDHL